MTRVPAVFGRLDASACPAVTQALTFLLVGTGAEPGVAAGSQRSDVLMLARIDPTRPDPTASVVSIPRDGWVDIPGRGLNEINAAGAFGGPPLLRTRTATEIASRVGRTTTREE